MSKQFYRIKVIAYQKYNRPLKEGEEPEVFEFCCWDSLKKWLIDNSPVFKCNKCAG
jgi:hypothetical protein